MTTSFNTPPNSTTNRPKDCRLPFECNEKELCAECKRHLIAENQPAPNSILAGQAGG